MGKKDHRTHGFAGHAQRYGRVAELDDVTFLRQGQVLQADTMVLDAPRLKIAVLRELEQDPLCLVQAQAK